MDFINRVALFSDIMDEMGLKQVLHVPFGSNFLDASIAGNVVTLHVRKIKDGDDPKQIYRGLEIFQHIKPKDVVFVSTECPEFAYWGELNTRLAIRAGAIGTIVAGMTRDSFHTKQIGYAVFSLGSFAQDVKGRGVVDQVNTPVDYCGVMICPGDFVIADVDGVVVIPKDKKEEVFKRAEEMLKIESGISTAIGNNIPIKEILDQFGFF